MQLLKSEIRLIINELNEDNGVTLDKMFSRGKEILMNFEYDLNLNGL